jgi:hypothetical protein
MGEVITIGLDIAKSVYRARKLPPKRRYRIATEVTEMVGSQSSLGAAHAGI